MTTAGKFRINYFVGGGLALGGDLVLDGVKIIFSPTSAIDRAMGAKNVEIPIKEVRGLEFAGSLSRSFLIKTEGRNYKFEGSQAKQVWEVLDKAMPAVQTSAPAPAPATPSTPAPVAAVPAPAASKPISGLSCDQCTKALQPGYTFCPSCAARIKSVCSGCHKTIDPTWAVCAFCGWKFSAR